MINVVLRAKCGLNQKAMKASNSLGAQTRAAKLIIVIWLITQMWWNAV